MASPERSSAAVQRTERSISEAQKRRLEEYKEPLKDVDPPARLSWRSSSENHISIAVKKGGFLYMAKSWAIRTSLSTSIGQAVILQRMGPHASSLIEALTECVKLLKGSKEAKEFKSDLLRVSAKGKLIIDEGVLRQRDVFRCEIAAVALGKTVLDFLGYSDFKKVEIQNPFLIKVRSYLFELRSIILSAVNGLVSRRTIAIINSISNLLESSPFLNLFFYSPEADSSREYLHQTLLTLLGPLFKDQCRSSYRNSICSYDSSVHQSKEEEIAIEDSSDNAQYDHESSCTSLKGATASSVVEKRRSHQSSWIK